MENNKLQLCTFDQAKKLKEAGFDWECHAYYMGSGRWFDLNIPENHNQEMTKEKYSRPSIALALKWFRSVKKEYGYVFPNPLYKHEKEWCFEIIHLYDENSSSGMEGAFTSHDQAESALLDQLLEIVETTKNEGENEHT